MSDSVFDVNSEERFWSQVNIGDDCWEWIGPTAGKGYGRTTWNGKGIGAHRLSWIIANGPIPEGIFVCHHCDNPPCVRPDHLFLGTVQDNMTDAKEKGRIPKGDQHYTRQHPELATPRSTHCKRGHPLTPDNLHWNKKRGCRQCKECKNMLEREAWHRAKLVQPEDQHG